jgi:hypothetical protein
MVTRRGAEHSAFGGAARKAELGAKPDCDAEGFAEQRRAP